MLTHQTSKQMYQHTARLQDCFPLLCTVARQRSMIASNKPATTGGVSNDSNLKKYFRTFLSFFGPFPLVIEKLLRQPKTDALKKMLLISSSRENWKWPWNLYKINMIFPSSERRNKNINRKKNSIQNATLWNIKYHYMTSMHSLIKKICLLVCLNIYNSYYIIRNEICMNVFYFLELGK